MPAAPRTARAPAAADARARCTRRAFALGTLALVAALSATGAASQSADWPAKPIRMIINFPPGSSPDIVGRAIAQPLGQQLGQPVVIENRAGAGGHVGVEALAKSAPDGYTILTTAGSTLAIGPHVYAKLPYDPARDITPVAAGARIENFLIVRADLPVKTYQQFVEYAKKNGGRMSYGSAGNGTSPHIAAEMWKQAAGITATHIPYRGTAPAIQDMLGGQFEFMFDSGSAFPHVRSGKFLMLAVAMPKRLAMFPDVPTLDELGLKGFETGTTHSVYAPAGTPPAILERLNREINRALSNPTTIQQIQALGAEPTPMSIAQLRALMDADSKRYAAIVKSQGIRAD